MKSQKTLLLSTSPRPESERRPPMNFGFIPKRLDQDWDRDADCLRLDSLREMNKQAKANPDRKKPDRVFIDSAEMLAKLAIGNKRFRRVGSKRFSLDSTGVVHISTVVPSQRRQCPALITTWKGVA